MHPERILGWKFPTLPDPREHEGILHTTQRVEDHKDDDGVGKWINVLGKKES